MKGNQDFAILRVNRVGHAGENYKFLNALGEYQPQIAKAEGKNFAAAAGKEGVGGELLEHVLYRKEANTGSFKSLSEPMQHRHVDRVARQAGIGLKGIKVKIVRDENMIGRACFGYAHPNGNMIYLYPDAFTDVETLVKTIGHERMHIHQVKLFGAPIDNVSISLYEQAAWESEQIWWNFYLRGGR